MALAPIYYCSAPEVQYLESTTSSHPIKAEGYEIHSGFIS
jgi:hypothetical protein